MRIFVTGNDTDIGKTYVCQCLASYLQAQGKTVRYVKPLQCGLDAQQQSDADALRTHCCAQTYHYYQAAMAPLQAAARENASLPMAQITTRIQEDYSEDILLIEGAGGIAVPLDKQGQDWAHYAQQWQLTYTILVIQNRLGAINQARLTSHYAHQHQLRCGIWLNSTAPQEEYILSGNQEALSQESTPLWAITAWQSPSITANQLPF